MKFLKKYATAIALSVVILVLCLMPVPETPELPMTDFDKLVHVLMFMGASGVVFFDNTNRLRQKTSPQRIVWGSFVFPLLFGGFIEILQSFSAFRTGDWFDFFFDGVGALCGLLLCFVVNRKIG
ncbi:hypothetical protein SAMD00024442_50_6 [Candidatus Symbiothrix dinenymphae]|nr:hypothetical protein SAMD00024442_50_6 [Candidatus Symbiothrix dinenymphae]